MPQKKRGKTTSAAVGNKTCRSSSKGPAYSQRHYIHVARIIGDAWARCHDPKNPGLNVKKLEFLAELVIMLAWEFSRDNPTFDEPRFLEAVLGNLLECKRLRQEDVEELSFVIATVSRRRRAGEGGDDG